MESTVRTAVVGYGYAGRAFHSYLIGLTPGLDLVAVSTRDPQRQAAAQDHGEKVVGSIDELLDDASIDLVVIATPHDTHAELCIKAMDAGKHVVVDKAMCLTSDEADAMLAARDRNGVMLSVFHNRRWDGGFLTVKHVKGDGLLGEWFAVEAAIGYHGTARNWRAVKAQVGGQLYDWGAHLVDQALVLADARPIRVFCHARPVVWDMDVDSHCLCVLEFEDGLLYTIEVCRASRIPKPRWRVLGSRGSLEKTGLDPQEAFMREGRIDDATQPPEDRARVVADVDGTVTERVLETVPGRWRCYYENIADVLLRGAELAVKPEEAAEVVRVIEAAMRSAESGQAVEF